MKDYSKYFKNPEAFITKIDVHEISSLNKSYIEVTFANNIVNKYPLTKENIAIFYQKLEAQYREVLNNDKLVVSNSKTKKLVVGWLFINIILYLTYTFNLLVDSLMIGLFGANAISIMGIVINESTKSSHKKLLRTYDYILKNMENLEKTANVDQNILKDISRDANAQLSNERKLKERDIVNSSFTINWIDNASRKDLESVLTQLKIYQGLQEKPEFINKQVDYPSLEQEQIKTKKKTI